ncbi:hypothetical protein HOLleu_00787 [Holothuria leucospilota]|uniref:PHD-type domain-containing protein n=1 Tax=Holothuria leucospilota TaxID=206669 RepID=A0A9Q1CNG1_HOLLE|nr:hypothetical protein HOLleu_00787 [Holothuria leucospilota]
MRDNPGKPITRYDISRLFTIAYHSGATMGNLVNGFKYTGIFPLDAKAIPDHAYALAETTEQAKTIHLQEGAPPKSSENDDSVAPAETTGQATSNVLQESEPAQSSENDGRISNEDTDLEVAMPSIRPEMSTESSSNLPCEDQGSTSSDTTSLGGRVSFSDILPLPKAAPVKRKRSHKSLIGLVTSADVIERLEKEKKQKESVPKSQKNAQLKKSKGKLPAAKKVKCKASAEQDPDNFCGYCNDYYFDMDDEDEDWLYCKRCLKWYHESCFGLMVPVSEVPSGNDVESSMDERDGSTDGNDG